MDEEIDLHTVPLTSLTHRAQILLYALLDTTKILLSEGPDKLPRDWRGLAALVKVPNEIAGSFDTNMTKRVIDYWIEQNDGSATVGQLLAYIQRIDRYDIFDDFVNLQARGELLITQTRRNYAGPIAVRGTQALSIPDEQIQENMITFDDKIHGNPQLYHAYVLYAQEDRAFVDEMLIRMREKGFHLCTEDDLLPDHQTTYAPVSRLISSARCHRIILVYSPSFLTSPANQFYMDYAQAVGIEMKKPKIIPLMYEKCDLPPQVMFYHKLYYKPTGAKPSYDFWEKLALSLDIYNRPQPRMVNGELMSAAYSALNITEYNSNSNLNPTGLPAPQRLALTQTPHNAHSRSYANGIDNIVEEPAESEVLATCSTSRITVGRSQDRPSKFKRFLNRTFKKFRQPKRRND